MKTLQVIIETPKGSNQKYHYDENTHFFHLKKILPVGMIFPFDFGFLPGTKGEDGDPLDVLVISELCNFPGSVVECRLIGGFKAVQSSKDLAGKKIRNDRFFAIPVLSLLYREVQNLPDLPAQMIKETEDFFVQYNKLERKSFLVLENMGTKEATKLISKNSKN